MPPECGHRASDWRLAPGRATEFGAMPLGEVAPAAVVELQARLRNLTWSCEENPSAVLGGVGGAVLRVGERRFAVSGEVAMALRRLMSDGAPPAADRDVRVAKRLLELLAIPPMRSVIAFRRTLIPAWVVARLVAPLAGLFTREALLAVSMIVTALLWLLALSRPAPFATGALEDPLLFGAGFLAIMLGHELGHVSASRASGAEPGEIGCGLYFIFPVLYANVDSTWHLPRSRRVIVTLGGLYFQLIAAVPLLLLALIDARSVWVALLVANAIAGIHMLNPLLRLDGYWLLSDLAGVENLRTHAARLWRAVLRGETCTWATHRLRVFVLTYGVAAGAYMLLIAGLLAKRTGTLADIASLPLVAFRGAPAGVSPGELALVLLKAGEVLLLAAAWYWVLRRLLRVVHGLVDPGQPGVETA